jgi:hypothetical protein
MSSGPREEHSETEALRALYRRLQGPGDQGCPPSEILVQLVVGDATGEERARLVDHVVACRRCSEDYAMLRETHAAASRELAVPSRVSRATRGRLAALAAVCLLGLAGILLVSRQQPHEGAVRSLAAPEPGTRVTPRAGATLGEAPTAFSWPQQRDATSYQVRLFDAAGRGLWQGPTTPSPQAALPEEVRRRLGSGSFFWTVEVETRLGKERLGPFPFNLAPP